MTPVSNPHQEWRWSVQWVALDESSRAKWWSHAETWGVRGCNPSGAVKNCFGYVMLDGSLQGDCEFETKTDKNRPTQTSGYSKSAEMPPKKSCHLKTVLVEMQIQPLNYPIKVYPVGTPPSSSWELAQLLRTSSLYSLERRVIPKFRVPSGKPSHNYA